jgi:hypothetical protein
VLTYEKTGDFVLGGCNAVIKLLLVRVPVRVHTFASVLPRESGRENSVVICTSARRRFGLSKACVPKVQEFLKHRRCG